MNPESAPLACADFVTDDSHSKALTRKALQRMHTLAINLCSTICPLLPSYNPVINVSIMSTSQSGIIYSMSGQRGVQDLHGCIVGFQAV